MLTLSPLQYSSRDSGLVHGANVYRAKVLLNTGQVIYSDPQTVYYTGSGDYFVYPNPVRLSQSIHILAAGLDNALFRLYDAQGRLVRQKILYNLMEDMPAQGLAAGLYFYSIGREGQIITKGSLLLQ
ncbi:MAG: T9SS type A sorting domain-containing protein [Bacteroidetes bacterium]|nr:T9SS type A sorting domain-containing protein [Bacteroidota bacterium]